ncbi:MAG TPA: PQQ-dependent sugar dehydrogenase, partial [Methylophilus sp.]|nr:PQQ-dependent sugar dehydrogenase [Methylophilus sp.]
MFDAIIAKLSALLTLGICSIPNVGCANAADVSAPPANLPLKLPTGFAVNIFAKLEGGGAEYFSGPRMMTFDKNGNLYVTTGRSNQVIMLPDANKDGVSEAPILISDKFKAPNGLAFVGEDLLVANEDGVVKLTQRNGVWFTPQPFIGNLPTGGHTLKTIKVSPDNFLYLNVGSSCNVCVESDPTRATILRYTSEGKAAGALKTVGRHAQSPIWAQGLRNSQGFAWHPQTGSMYATNNGADMRSDKKGGKVNDDIPPEHLNKIEPGKHYGWPYCWANPKTNAMTEDPNFVGEADFCKGATQPATTFTSHSTPIGITFLDKSHFPDEYKNDAIVALHGSWNRKEPSGYKLVRVKFKDGQPVDVIDFATGWL